MAEEVTAIKEKGNKCLKEEKYEEAVLHYSHAVKLDPKNYSLYSNRSLAFLKMQQYYLAMEDAKETIKIRPDWAKGYFRRAEVIRKALGTGDKTKFWKFNALISYKMALALQPNDPSLEEAVKKTKAALKREKASDDQIPWIGAAIGIFLGALIVVADQIFTHKPVLGNPMLMVLITIAIAVLGYFIANALRNYIKSQRIALLEPPVNLFQDTLESNKEDNARREKETRSRQARQRFKKGKS